MPGSSLGVVFTKNSIHPSDPSLALRMTWKKAPSLFVILSREAKDLSAAGHAVVWKINRIHFRRKHACQDSQPVSPGRGAGTNLRQPPVEEILLEVGSAETGNVRCADLRRLRLRTEIPCRGARGRGGLERFLPVTAPDCW